jgi:hypothetical protein
VRYLGALLVGAVCAPAFAAPGDFPHWDGKSCATCHGEGAPTSIKNYDDKVMCGKCHDESGTLSCRHPSNIAVGSAASASVGDVYRDSIRAGKLVCTTCHDPLVQCQGDKLAPYLNPRFLRGGPFRQADEACLLCHDKSSFPKLDPHDQLAGTDVKQAVCGFCHAAAADRITASTAFRIDPSKQCLACHAVSPHPMSMIPGSGIDSWNHLVVPGESSTRQMDATRARTGERLPLDPHTGKITCATCHDPHAAGVIAGDPQFLEKARLRPVARCENCHEK